MSPRIPMKVRNVRVSDRDWNAAHERAERDGDNLSEKIREFIRAYGKGDAPFVYLAERGDDHGYGYYETAGVFATPDAAAAFIHDQVSTMAEWGGVDADSWRITPRQVVRDVVTDKQSRTTGKVKSDE